MEILLVIDSFFKFATAYAKVFPSWLERRKTEYLKLRKDYLEEWNKPTTERDGNKADMLRIELHEFHKVFWREIETNSQEVKQ